MTSFGILSLKIYVNVSLKSKKQKNFFYQFFVCVLKVYDENSVSQRHGSADPDPHQNVMDPQHADWTLRGRILILFFHIAYTEALFFLRFRVQSTKTCQQDFLLPLIITFMGMNTVVFYCILLQQYNGTNIIKL